MQSSLLTSHCLRIRLSQSFIFFWLVTLIIIGLCFSGILSEFESIFNYKL